MNAYLLRTADIRTLEAQYLPHTPLMERAGLAAADYACEILSQHVHADGEILVLAGNGNNGGDAYVCARHLKARGHAVLLLSNAPDAPLPPDAAAARKAWLAAGGAINTIFPHNLNIDLAVDGLFGIGFNTDRPLESPLADWITRFNQLTCPRLALDIPSGLDADTGNIGEAAIIATHTVTFLANKPGLYTLNGIDRAGHIRYTELGISPDFSEDITRHAGRLICPNDFASAIKPRLQNTHKGSFGSAAIIGGSSGMAGAALLSARAALHLGAGRVYVGMLTPLTLDAQQPELMLRSTAEAMAQSNAIGIGPGMGDSSDALSALKLAIATDKPLAIDADALNLLALHPVLANNLARRCASTLLTPHPAEAARLAGTTVAAIQHDRIASALSLAKRFNASVVLKGAGSVVATPDQHWFINTSGNAGLATAGSGDVLLGIVTALLAQGADATSALLAAVHLHGVAADDLVAAGIGPIGLTAGELIPAARQRWNQWVNNAQANAPE